MNNQFPAKQIELELFNSFLFEANDESGKSRVCARKAAGFALRYWFQHNNNLEDCISPFKAIELFYEMSNIAPDLRKAAGHLLQKVEADYHFPQHINLIKEAEKLITFVKLQTED